MQLRKQCFSRLTDFWNEYKSRPETSFTYWSLAAHDWQNALFVVKSALSVAKVLKPVQKLRSACNTWIYLHVCECQCVHQRIVHLCFLKGEERGQLSLSATSMQTCRWHWISVFQNLLLSHGLYLSHPVLNVSHSPLVPALVAAEERRRLCKCLLYESLLKMWLESDKHKTSGHRPNICCLEGGGWSEQGHGRNTEGKEEKRERKQSGNKRLKLAEINWC